MLRRVRAARSAMEGHGRRRPSAIPRPACGLRACRDAHGNGRSPGQQHRRHLCELLGLDDAELAAGLDGLDPLWNQLTWWLDERHEGRLGISTIVGDEHFTHIGYPISQTLFRGADAPKVDELFRWISLEPDEEVDEDVLLAYFRVWAPGKGLSAGALRMAAEPQLNAAMARILGAYARQWDGTSSGAGGKRRAALRVVVRRSRGLAVSLEALQPEGFSSRLEGRLGAKTLVVDAEDGVFALVGPVDARLLLEGIRVASDDCELVLEGSAAHVLQLDAELGGWASVDAIAPGTRHWLLVHPDHRDDVLGQLARTAESVGTNEPAGDPLLGWIVIRDVIFRQAVSLTGALATRSPTDRHRLSLRGGLLLRAPRGYLAGGAPDLWLPASPGEDPSPVTLDGAAVPSGSAQIRLAEHLDVTSLGRHAVEWSGLTRSFTLVPSVRRMPPDDVVLAHALEIDAGRVTAYRGVSADAGGDIRIRGAIAEGHTADARPAAVLVRRDAQRAWLLGARAGEVHETQAPQTPSWLRRAGLFGRLYEERAEFAVAWVVEEWQHEPPLRARPAVPLTPALQEEVEPASRELWSHLLREATLIAADEDAQQRLALYRAIGDTPGTAA